MTEHEIEPIRGLPGLLPAGERILWQGSPDARTLARSAFHARSVAIYFGLLTAVALGMTIAHGSGFTGALMTAALGLAAVGMLQLLGWLAARASVYTLTNRRIVLRIGVALPTCVNLPLTRVAAIDLSAGGDIALRLNEAPPLGWVALWPHARPWRLARPAPMLRAVPDAAGAAALIARACLAVQPEGRMTAVPAIPATPARALPEAVVA